MASMALAFDILARDRASSTMNRVGKSSDGLGKKLAGVGRVGAVALATGIGVAAVGGVAALGAAMIQGVKDAASYQQLAAKTAAVLKSTGNVAHQSVKGIQARASALEHMSGVDETVIINSQNVLATFTKVTDGVGKSNNIFTQATKVALDMSTALGTDLQGATLQVGKALQDPVKGVTALRRAGVSLDAQQLKNIQTLVAHGKTLQAQKIILGELTKEFGGAAKAAGQGFTGSMARAKDSIQDAFRAIGIKLLPTLTKLADYVATHAGPFIDNLSAAFGRVWSWVSGKLWPALQKGYQTILPGIQQALSTVTGGLKGNHASWKQLGDIIVNKVIPVISTIVRYWLPAIALNWRIIIEVVKKVVEAVKRAWEGFQTFMHVVGAVTAFVLRRFADMASGFAVVLRALGHVPGFDWATRAGNKLAGAAAQARALANAISAIPANKTVTVNTYFKTHGSPNPLSTSGSGAGVKGFATGVRNFAGGFAVVGESGPELVRLPKGSDVYTASESRAMSRGGNRVDLSEASLQRLAAILSGVQTTATISASAVDRAMGGTLR
jgi:hypothetical protein